MIPDDDLRAWRWHKQGLDGSISGENASGILERTGWARSVAGCCPYLTLFTRAGLRRDAVDAAVATAEIHELPSARGCTYVVPASQFGLALSLSHVSSEQELKVARKLGVTDVELDALCVAVKQVLKNGALTPDEIRTAVGDASRSLGVEGTKKGITTTLPLALGKLQSTGEIRRTPLNGRLDQQRYKYQLWPAEAARKLLPLSEAHAKLARLYFDWIGPATLTEFQWFSGLTGKAAKEAIAPLELADLGGGLLLPSQEKSAFEAYNAPSKPHFNLVSGLDALILLRRDAPGLLPSTYKGVTMMNDKGKPVAGASLADLPANAILDRGSLVGLWEYDPEAAKVVYWSFGGASKALTEAVQQMESYIQQDLGDARSFSLDSPKSRAPRISYLREAGI